MTSSSEMQRVLTQILKVKPLQHLPPSCASKLRPSPSHTPIPELHISLDRIEAKLRSRGLPPATISRICDSLLQHVKRSNNFEQACARLIALPRAPGDEPIDVVLNNLKDVYHSFIHDRLLVRLESEVLSQLDKTQRKPHTQSKKRPPFNHEFTPLLEKYFEFNAYPSAQDRELLARKSMMEPRQIEVWFQNHRNRAKKDGRVLKKLSDHPLPTNLNLHSLSRSMPTFLVKQEAGKRDIVEPSITPPRDAVKPIDLLSPAAPLHAFPTKYPPTVAYSPFPDAFHFPPPTWRRTPCSTVQQHKAAVDVDQLAKDFLQKLHIGGSELANKRPSTQLPTWYPLLTVPSPAPHPALVKPITSPPPRQNARPGTARSRLRTVSRLPHRQPSAARSRTPYSRAASASSVSSVDSDELLTPPPSSPALLSQLLDFCESGTSFLHKHFDSGHNLIRRMRPLAATVR